MDMYESRQPFHFVRNGERKHPDRIFDQLTDGFPDLLQVIGQFDELRASHFPGGQTLGNDRRQGKFLKALTMGAWKVPQRAASVPPDPVCRVPSQVSAKSL